MDLKVEVLVLKLDRPIDVIAAIHKGPDQDYFRDVRRVQIVGFDSLNLNGYLNRHVVLRGTLFEKENGNHYTDVLIEAQKLVSAE